MEGSEVLIAIAEVAAAFAGFAGIVAVFRHRDLEAWPPNEAYRFRLMVLLSVSSIMFALLPFFLFHSGVSPLRVWSSASALLALAAFAQFTRTFLGYRALEDNARSHINFGAFVALETGHVVVGCLQVANAAGVGAGPSFGLYLVGIGWFLLVAAGLFVRLLLLTPGRSR